MRTPRQPAPPLVHVTPEPGTELAQLMAMQPAAEAAVAEAKQQAESIKTAIETEAVRIAAAANGDVIPPGIRIAGVLGLPAQIMRWHGDETTFDGAKFDADYPGVRDQPQYRKPKQPYWRMDKEGGR